jgi:hypothetical protein
MNTVWQNRQVKLIQPKNEFYKQNNLDINTTKKSKYLKLTEEYYQKLNEIPDKITNKSKYVIWGENTEYETYHSEIYERYTNGEDSPSYLTFINAKSFKGEFMRELFKIYHELNIYKKHEMQVHPESDQFTRMHIYF